MTNFGEWVKKAKAWRVGVGIAMLAATAIFSLGAATNGAVTNLKQIPQRMDRLEGVTDTLVLRLGKHITQDSTTTARIFCVVAALAEGDGRLINPLDPCRRD